MEHLATIKLTPSPEGIGGNLEFELYWDGTVQLIKTPEHRSYFIDAEQVAKLVEALQVGLAKARCEVPA